MKYFFLLFAFMNLFLNDVIGQQDGDNGERAVLSGKFLGAHTDTAANGDVTVKIDCGGGFEVCALFNGSVNVGSDGDVTDGVVLDGDLTDADGTDADGIVIDPSGTGLVDAINLDSTITITTPSGQNIITGTLIDYHSNIMPADNNTEIRHTFIIFVE